MLSGKSFSKICLEGNEVFLMPEYESKKQLTINILDIKNNKSYVGQISDHELKIQAERLGLNYSDFINQSNQALFQNPKKPNPFVFSLQKYKENHQFKWKSVDHEETIITIGCIEMTQQDYVPVFDSILVSLAKEILDLNSKVTTLQAQIVECKSQTENALNQLSEAVEIKNNLEEELFSKFLLVLNEKKRKIRELKSGKSSKTTKFKTSHSNKTKMLVLSDSSEEEVDGILDHDKPGPSTSMKRCSLPFHDDEEDTFVPVNPSKIRNRSKGNNIDFFSGEIMSYDKRSNISSVASGKLRNRNTGNKVRPFSDKIMPANVESTLSQVMDDDSDDLISNL